MRTASISSASTDVAGGGNSCVSICSVTGSTGVGGATGGVILAPFAAAAAAAATAASTSVSPPHGVDDCPSRKSAYHSRQSLAVAPAGSVKKQTFVDAAAMKEKVRQNLTKPKYNVNDFYKSKGVWQALARSQHFERGTLGVIGFNAIWIAIDTDMNTTEGGLILSAPAIFQLAENFFCTFFSFECYVRFMAFKNKVDGFKDAWFVFDLLMVLMMVVETWLLSAVVLFSEYTGLGDLSVKGLLRMGKLLRMMRMCRVGRLLRATPELMILIKGLLAAFRSVFFTLLLITALLFVFAIAFTQLTLGTEYGEGNFGSVTASMYYLMLHGAFLLSADYKALELQAAGGHLLVFLFFTFILFAAVLLMNMLIGVLCQVVSAVAASEKEELLVMYVRTKLEKVMAIIDEDGGGTISRDEFMLILDNLEAMEALHDIGVDVVGLVDFADFIFGDDADLDEDYEVELTLPEFLEVILQLRGSNNATVKDIVDLRKFVRNTINLASEQVAAMHTKLADLSDLVDSLQEAWEENATLDKTFFEDEAVKSSCEKTTIRLHDEDPPIVSVCVFIHGAWHAVDAPEVSISVASKANADNKLTCGIPFLEPHTTEEDCTERPYLPATANGLTGLKVAGYCGLLGDAGAMVQDCAPERTTDGVRTDVAEQPPVPVQRANIPSFFKSSKYFLPPESSCDKPFLPTTSAGLSRQSLAQPDRPLLVKL
eukprot:TRINITY_DN13597_c0_g3_i2.p1 TRINITY_DN13597_c0_g3~~TRINITY_DN13597_c0_g3_i2.p1  ORF type:complete len:711 (-),score=132.19 TRINITY_DN13597_c0_g3_i2:57-2189(-)